MIMPVHGTVTAKFSQPRPLQGKPTHVHGAVDVAAPVGRRIVAPESGHLRAWLAHRPKDGHYWPKPVTIRHKPLYDGNVNIEFPYRNYFYDMYGGILVLRNPTRTHIFTHIYANQLFDHGVFESANLHWMEEEAKTRWPIFAVYTDEIAVTPGQTIGYVGDAGYSTGPHVHWEIHNGYQWQAHEERPDPLDL